MMTIKDFKGIETAFMTIRVGREEPEVRECAISKIGKLYVTAKINEFHECRFKNVREYDDFLSCRDGYREYRLFPTRQLAEADVNRDKLISDIQNVFISYSGNKYKYTVEQLQRILSITQEG